MIHRISSVSDLSALNFSKLADGDKLQLDPVTFKARLCVTRGVEVCTNPNSEYRATLDCLDAPMYGAEQLRAGYHRDFFSQAAGIISAAPTGLPSFSMKGYTGPKGVKISNLTITGANNPVMMLNSQTGLKEKVAMASGIYVWWADGIEISNCLVTGNSQGIFNNGQAMIHDEWIHDCEFTRNGTPGSYREHQLYLEALGLTFERNHIHDPIASFQGSAYKSRSGGEVIRNNVIEDGGFLLDLCDPQPGSKYEVGYIALDPRFQNTEVYDNQFKQGLSGGTYFCHFGDDQVSRYEDPAHRWMPERSRPHLTMRNNTLAIDKAKMSKFGLFDLRSNDQHVDCDGLKVNAKNAAVAVVCDYGNVNLTNCTLPTPHAISSQPLKGTVIGA